MTAWLQADTVTQPGETTQFNAQVYDQFGNLIPEQPTVTWNATSGQLSNTTGASIQYTAPLAQGDFQVSASADEAIAIRPVRVEIATGNNIIVSDNLDSGYDSGTGWDDTQWDGGGLAANRWADETGGALQFSDGSDYIERDVTLPAGTIPSLFFDRWWAWAGGTRTYTFTISVIEADNTTTQVFTLSDDYTATATREQVDLSAYAGQTITLAFRINTNSGNTRFRIDNIDIIDAVGNRVDYDIWKAAVFANHPSGTSGAHTEPDYKPHGQGLDNFAYYALGVDLNEPLESAPVEKALEDLSGQRLSISLSRLSNLNDVTYEVLASNDLIDWDVIARSTNGNPFADVDGLSHQILETEDGVSTEAVVYDNATTETHDKRFIILQVSPSN